MAGAQEQEAGRTVQLRVKGTLDPRWSDWFDGFCIQPLPDGDCLLTGQVEDQAALYGLLCKVRDLGLWLVSLNPGPPRGDDPEGG